MTSAQPNKGSRIARLSAARLAAVQALYQMKSTGQGAASIIGEFKAYRLGKPVDEEAMILPDGVLFEQIVSGVSAREEDLRGIIDTSLAGQKGPDSPAAGIFVEPLLDSILLCGAYELLAHHDTDAPVIISDYLEVTHAFYEGGESRLVNGVLDNINKAVRSLG